jgi:hypothetical protein
MKFRLRDAFWSANLIERLRDTLRRVQAIGANDFSGIGLVVCDLPETLPIVSLLEVSEVPHERDLETQLAAISSRHSKYHDGFHIISTTWQLTKVAQYFSPPIVLSAKVDRSKRFGGRYLAALFGSAIPGVTLSGISSNGFGIAIFKDGQEVLHENYQ